MKTRSILLLTTLTGLSFTLTLSALRAAEESAKPPVSAEAEKPKVKPYPLTTCIVTDEDLGEMGKPVTFTYKDQEIKICCKPCRKKFDKEPEKYLKKLEPKKK